MFSLSWGRYPVPLDAVWQTLTGQNTDETYQNIIFNLRLPRIAAAMLVGMALSLAGAVYQGIFRNPLVSPDLLGVSSGACVGAAAAVIAGGGMLAMQGAAFGGGLDPDPAAPDRPRLGGGAGARGHCRIRLYGRDARRGQISGRPRNRVGRNRLLADGQPGQSANRATAVACPRDAAARAAVAADALAD
ncbi:iron chelate uptake ABC transporter, FeCT family, permease protein [Neisseria sp. oral taxon 020 str. F0370]|nr:iron chelate uptake ABC transporter, FeCT family, permease protein [Neisseria sp. oral taxon 020 str. F0370]